MVVVFDSLVEGWFIHTSRMQPPQRMDESTMERMKEIETRFKKMMHDFEEVSQNDVVFRKDIEELGKFTIQWNICELRGYQILELDSYSYDFGDTLDDPDITFTFTDADEADRFLRGESFREFTRNRHKQSDQITFRYTQDWRVNDEGKKKRIRKDVMTASFDANREYHPALLEKLPMFRSITRIKGEFPKNDNEEYGSYIPINQSLGTTENEILPTKVFENFFSKASNIVMLNDCPCRVYEGCEDHDHSIGCMHLGDDTLKILVTPERGRIISKEEAMETLERAVEDGLIPLLGRQKGEARGMGVPDTGHFMSMCFCCTCCCINAKYGTHGSTGNMLNRTFHRMEGVTVEVDEEACNGCEYCLDVCVFNGMKMIDGIANVTQDRCLGCGRCETECPIEAISINIDEQSRVNELIKTLESYVDVEPQQSV
jgi:UDP-glucose 4-epimerase